MSAQKIHAGIHIELTGKVMVSVCVQKVPAGIHITSNGIEIVSMSV